MKNLKVGKIIYTVSVVTLCLIAIVLVVVGSIYNNQWIRLAAGIVLFCDICISIIYSILTRKKEDFDLQENDDKKNDKSI